MLHEGEGSKTFRIWLKQDLEDFEVRLDYGGKGSLELSGITLVKSRQTYAVILLCWLLSFFLADSILFLFYYGRNNVISGRQTGILIGMAGIILFSSYPLFYDYLLYGTDIRFHLMRIEGIKDALRGGMFPVKLYPSWLNGYGYAVPVFYGDILLYFPALLRIAGLPLQTAYQAYCILVNAAACAVSYYVCNKIFRDSTVALFGSGIYTLSAFRMMMMYSRPMVGLSAGMIFLPLILYGSYRILTEDTQSREYRTAWLPLAVGLSGVIQTHVLTCVMLVHLIPVLLLIFLRRLIRKPVFLMFCKAAGAVILINLGFLLPFLDGMLNWDLNITDPARRDVMYNIQSNGIPVSNLFAIFPQESSLPYQTDYSIGIGLLAGLILFILVIFVRKETCNRSIRGLGIASFALGILTMYLSTNRFGWDRLAGHLGNLSTLVRNLQFPWRFLAFATLFLTVVSCVSVSVCRDARTRRLAMCSLACLGMLSTGWVMSKHVSETDVMKVYDTEGMDGYDYETGWGTKEYLPRGMEKECMQDGKPVPGEGIDILAYERVGAETELQCSNRSGGPGYVDIPLIFYKGYQAVDRDGAGRITLEENESHCVRAVIPADYIGTITIRFTGTIWWRLSYWVSAISVAAAGLYAFSASRCGCRGKASDK